MSSTAKTSMPVQGMNPMNVMMIGGFQAVFTGIMFAGMKYNLEGMLAVLPAMTVEGTMALLVLLAGLVQGMMAAKTNWARVEYKNPWPHTFCLESNPDKLRFDMVQRAHLNFVENYAQFLAVAYFAARLAPKCAAVFGTIFLLGRVVFALGYYSGVAEKKDNGAFGYMLGIFPLCESCGELCARAAARVSAGVAAADAVGCADGMAWLFMAQELKLLSF
jgi:glutathione S-transferase